MPTHHNQFRVRTVACTVAITGFAGAFALLYRSSENGSRILEILLYTALFLVLLNFRVIQSYLSEVPSAHRKVFAVLVAGMMFGQVASRSQRTFPFPHWEMYGRPENPPSLRYFKYTAVREDGSQVDLSPAVVFRSVATMQYAFQKLVDRSLRAHNKQIREEGKIQLFETVRALGHVYNKRHPDQPIRTIHVIQVVTSAWRTPSSVDERQIVWKIDLETP